ncbi:MAG: DegV family protein [Bacillota bacterium]
MPVRLVTDGTCDIDSRVLQEYDIIMIPLTVNFPDESFKNNEVSLDYFFSKLETKGVFPSSSQPSQGEICSVFEDLIAKGNDVVAIFLSSGVSGTFETALGAREMVLQKFPEAKLEVLDSKVTAMALGLAVIEAAKSAKAGKPFDQVVAQAKNAIEKVRFYFAPATLEYLRRGGRIGGAAAILGSLLSINPILYYVNGKTAVKEKVRGAGVAVARMLNLMHEDFEAHGLDNIVVQHIRNLSKAKEVAQKIFERYGIEPPIVPVGPIVGLHVGPGTIGIIYKIK